MGILLSLNRYSGAFFNKRILVNREHEPCAELFMLALALVIGGVAVGAEGHVENDKWG